MERVKGIEPSSLAWEAKALPLSYTRNARIDAGNRGKRQGTVTHMKVRLLIAEAFPDETNVEEARTSRPRQPGMMLLNRRVHGGILGAIAV